MKINDTVHVFHYPTNTHVRTGKLDAISRKYGSIEYKVDGEIFVTSLYDYEADHVVLSDELYQNALRKGYRRYTDFIGVKVKFMIAQLSKEDSEVVLAKLEDLNTLLSEKAIELGVEDQLASAIRMWNAKGGLPKETVLSNIRFGEIKNEAAKADAKC